MPDYLILLRADPNTFDALSPAAFAELAGRFEAWATPLLAQGRFLAGQKLTTDSGRTVRHASDGVRVKDGPFGETKEMIGGYHLLRADDLDHVTSLCREHPNVTLLGGTLEIRELEATLAADRTAPAPSTPPPG
ncbi:MAG: YciI family protein [Planctomycetota bacterium]